jgi:carboxymethylenebutenolidase
MIHLGEKDEYIGPEAQLSLVGALRGNPLTRVWTYAGQCHAFARHDGKHYDKTSAELANYRTSEFFRKYLQPAGV